MVTFTLGRAVVVNGEDVEAHILFECKRCRFATNGLATAATINDIGVCPHCDAILEPGSTEWCQDECGWYEAF